MPRADGIRVAPRCLLAVGVRASIGYPDPMGKGLALLCVFAGAVVIGLALDLIPSDPRAFHAPRGVVGAAGAVFVIGGLLALSRDHRVSDALATLILLAFAGIAGWITFFAPEGTLQGGVPFVSDAVNETLGRLLFGFGTLLCIGMAAWAFRRLFR